MVTTLIENTFSHTNKFKILNLFFGLLLLSTIIYRGTALYLTFNPRPLHQNKLCLGDCYRLETGKPNTIQIGWKLTPDLAYKTKPEIFSIRSRRVLEYKNLLEKHYEPTLNVYGKIEDGLKWWGFDGYYQHLRSGDTAKWSTTGKTLRGEEIFNPFFLITLKPLTYTVENPNFRWNPRVNPGATGSLCPFWPRKSDLLWDPVKKRAEVVYFVKEYIELLGKNDCLETKLETQEISLGFDPVNAQDLGFLYLSFSKEDSENMSLNEVKSNFIPLEFYYHRGTSCKIAEGCNNISPLVKDLFGRPKTQSLPARIVFNLWSLKPSSPMDDSDFKYIIHVL